MSLLMRTDACAFPRSGFPAVVNKAWQLIAGLPFPKFSGCREQPCDTVPCFDWSQLHKSKYSVLTGSQHAPRIPIQSEPHHLLQLLSTTCLVRAALHDFLLPLVIIGSMRYFARKLAIAHVYLCLLGIFCFLFWAGFKKAANQAQNKSKTVRGSERRARFQKIANRTRS